MFGFSLQKLLLLAAVIGVVWYGFKMISRLQEARQLDRAARGRSRPAKDARRPPRAERPAEDIEEMVQCPVCDAYVAARGKTSCDRGDCPY